MSGVKFMTCDTNRLIKLTDTKIEMFKLDYEERRNIKNGLDDVYEPKNTWKAPKKIENIYDGFQTVFGYVMDTDVGTIIYDDNIDDPEVLSVRVISPLENVKVRHFYRSINYSHLLLNIKSNYLEIYSDLSDYFFPPKSKGIRKHISRHQARSQ